MKNILEIRNLSKNYASAGTGVVKVFNEVNFTVGEGELAAITGPSGSGKSTLLNIVGTLDTPTSGEVLVDEENLFKNSTKDLASKRNKKIGFIFQFHHLLPEFTALENVMMPALIAGIETSKASEKARSLLEEVGLGSRLAHRPSELSGGEAQRTAVARSFMMDPVVILADEPTGNLDAENSNKLFELMLSLSQKHKQTFLIATHNNALASRAGKKLHLEKGLLTQL
jgi:lipoprotein-releasing system ATP-binding protein